MKSYKIEQMNDYDKSIKVKIENKEDKYVDVYKKSTMRKKYNSKDDYKIVGEYKKSNKAESIGYVQTIDVAEDKDFSHDLYEEGEFNKYLYKTVGYAKVERSKGDYMGKDAYIEYKRPRYILPLLPPFAIVGGGIVLAMSMMNQPPVNPNQPVPIPIFDEQKQTNDNKDNIKTGDKETNKNNDKKDDTGNNDNDKETNEGTDNKDDDKKDDGSGDKPTPVRPVNPIPNPKPIDPIIPIPNPNPVPVPKPDPVPTPTPEPNPTPVPNPEPIVETVKINVENHYGDSVWLSEARKETEQTIKFTIRPGVTFENVTVNGKEVKANFDSTTGQGSVHIYHDSDKEVKINASEKQQNIWMVDTDIDYGFITPMTVVIEGHEVRVDFKLFEGRELDEVLVDGKPVKPTYFDKETGKGYLIVNPKDNMSVYVKTKAINYVEEFEYVTNNQYGDITPGGFVKEGEEVTIDYTIDEGYKYDGVEVDGELIENNFNEETGKGSVKVKVNEYTYIRVNAHKIIEYKISTNNKYGYITPSFIAEDFEKIRIDFDIDDIYDFRYVSIKTIRPTIGESHSIMGPDDIKFDETTGRYYFEINADAIMHIDVVAEQKSYRVQTRIENGSVTVVEQDKHILAGADSSVKFSLIEGYVIDEITVNGEPYTDYEFDETTGEGRVNFKVTSDLEIYIKGKYVDTYMINTRNNYGTITPSFKTKEKGEVKIEFSMDEGYTLNYILANGNRIDVNYDETTRTGSFTLNVDKSYNIRVYGTRKTFLVETAIDHGSISPYFSTSVGTTSKIEFTVDTGYELDKIFVNGEEVQVNSYDNDTGYGYVNVTFTKQSRIEVTTKAIA